MIVNGIYKGKPIRALLLPDTKTVQLFEYVHEPGNLYFPLIVDGENVEKDKFVLEDPIE